MITLFTQYDNQEQKMEFLKQNLLSDIMKTRSDKGNFYLFDHSAILDQKH